MTLTWSDLDRHVGWGNFFVIGASISLAHALGESGAAAWLARGLVGGLPGMGQPPARLGGAPLGPAGLRGGSVGVVVRLAPEGQPVKARVG
jgi:hypothetical protein